MKPITILCMIMGILSVTLSIADMLQHITTTTPAVHAPAGLVIGFAFLFAAYLSTEE